MSYLQNSRRVGYNCLGTGCFFLVVAFLTAPPFARGFFVLAGVFIGFGGAKLMALKRQ